MTEHVVRKSGFFERLIGGEALQKREAATTQRIKAQERLREKCFFDTAEHERIKEENAEKP